MTDLRKAAEMALEALEWNYGTDLCDIENCTAWLDKMNATIPALRQALAQQEPVGWMQPTTSGTYISETKDEWHTVPVYTAPVKPEWVGLTDEELEILIKTAWNKEQTFYGLARAIEAKLKEKNT